MSQARTDIVQSPDQIRDIERPDRAVSDAVQDEYVAWRNARGNG